MANPTHLEKLKKSVQEWNNWRKTNEELFPNLRKAHLENSDLAHAILRDVYLRRAYLSHANLSFADLREANLSGADLTGANLTGANLAGANLRGAKLNKAIIKDANLMSAILVDADFTGTTICHCQVFGISAWKLTLTNTIQHNLVITHPNEPTITVDNLEIAQFIHLLINNQTIRHVIDTMTSKVVLILGRFTPERKLILDQLREALNKRNFVSVIFDFEKPSNRDITETVSTLAHMARFIIADITAAKSIPQELQCIIPNLPSVPVQPIIHNSEYEYGMFEHYKRYPWVFELLSYSDFDHLLHMLDNKTLPQIATQSPG